MDSDEIHTEASHVKAEADAVTVEGPDGVDVKLTPDAAEETSDRLLEGSMIARGKRQMGQLPHGPK
jgi:hypothetical protein